MNPTRQGGSTIRSSSSPIAKVVTSFVGVESMTRQDQAALVNINNIYKKTQQGQMPLASSKLPTFGDFSDVGTYDVILERIQEATDAFYALPSETRAEYNNDPKVYYEKVTEQAKADYDAGQLAKAKLAEKEAYSKKVAEAKELLGINEEKDT